MVTNFIFLYVRRGYFRYLFVSRFAMPIKGFHDWTISMAVIVSMEYRRWTNKAETARFDCPIRICVPTNKRWVSLLVAQRQQTSNH